MARGVNKVIIVGNAGQDPETRHAANGKAIVNLSLATSETWKDKSTGEQREKTEWHRVVFFGKIAEIVSKYVRKGSQIYIEGKLQTRKWQDQSGQDKYTTEIVVDQGGQMQLLGSSSEKLSTTVNEGYAPTPTAAPIAPQPPRPPQPPVEEGFDDQIPF